MTEDVRDVIIVGSGPAGLTAAIYTARASLAPLMIEGEPSSTSDQPGGQLMLTTDVENFPGFPEGVMGPELMSNFRAQAERFGTELITERVTKLDLSSRPFGVWRGDTDAPEPTHRAKAVILATGARSLMLNLENETRLIGHGVSTCATCDGFFFKDEPIVVVGGGDSAMEEASFLARFGSSVTIVHRRDEFRASQIMQDRVLANPKISVEWNSEVTAIHGEDSLTGVTLTSTEDGSEREFGATGLFIAIGHRPNTDLFADQLEMAENGYLITAPDRSMTSIEGVFACGDLQDDHYRQAITAAGSGCMAAIDAERWLESQEG